ncbi:uncharacterized protein LOC106756924 [Vigna radiata var. radiata]|uniref:Uncharacterized protein LOC106756924 n=1 Tax=Vigna radiata var. radiata TaxID=3916 RepID=A0A3Q0EWD9_VIGRR|nr:uncharacterized protein LOC106756924 [Vigna radiata var. radiata]
MAVYSSDELVWCRVFSLSLKEEALDWFHSLQPGTIGNFAELRQLFTQQYATNKTPGVTYTTLVRMRQGRDESLKLFMDRFNRTARQVRNADQRLIVSALTTTLRPGPFCDYLHAEEPQSMDELQNRLASFIRIEEGRAHQRGREEGESTARTVRGGAEHPFGRKDRAVGPRGRDQNRMQRYVHHTPLNAPRARVLEEALRADLMAVVQIPTPAGADESRARLSSARRDPQVRNQQRADRSRSRSAERVVRGVINTILGGFAGGGSTSAARKRHLRNLRSVGRTGTSGRSMPTITFSDEDFHAPDLEQNDPMVITAMIARYQVSKVLVDQGSSANILYWKTFTQMEISEDAIMPFNEQIVGFAGEMVDTKGYVDLRTSLGTDRGAKEMKVDSC